MGSSQPRKSNGQFATTGASAPTAAPDVPAAVTGVSSPQGRHVADTYAAFQQLRGAANGGEPEPPVGVSGSAWVSSDAYVSSSARVFGDAKVSDEAQVYGSARVSDYARVSDSAGVFDSARVSGSARVSDDVLVFDSARVSGSAQVSGWARLGGSAQVGGVAQVRGEARVYGDARVFSGFVAGESDVSAPHHVQTWVDGNGQQWTVARSRVPAGFEVWRGDQPVTNRFPPEVESMIATVRSDG